MENFELIDNLFQITVLLCACVAAGILAIRHRNRSLLMLSLAYACFAMGTIYYVLYLVIIGIWPQVFYVAEISWLAAWLFYLSVQILPGEGKKDRFSLPAGAAAAVIAAIAFLDHDFGPSYFVSALFSLTAGATMYLSVSHMQNGSLYRKRDLFMIICVTLQVLLYRVSGFTHDYTRFQLYYAVDLALTLSMAALLPLLFFYLIFEPEPKEMPAAAIAIAVGFATFENVCYLTENGAANFNFLLIRGISAGALHILCGVLSGFGVSYVFRRHWLAATGTVGILGACIGFHAIYNLLITAEGAWKTAGYLFPSLLLLCLYAAKQLLPRQNISFE